MKLPCFGGLPFHARCKYPRLSIFILLFTIILLFLVFHYQPQSTSHPKRPAYNLQPKQTIPVVLINWNNINLNSKTICHFHSCFQVNDCIFDREDRIRVYVHDQYEFYNPRTAQSYVPEVSKEYVEILDAIRNSRYYEGNISQACVIVPPIDTLSQQQHDVKLVSVLLNSLPGWRDGENHLIFSMLPGSYPEFNNTPDFYYGRAMVAGGSFSAATHRHGFDISIPVFNALTHSTRLRKASQQMSTRRLLLTILSHGWQSEELTQQINSVAERHKDRVLVLERDCEQVSSSKQYPWKRCSNALGKVYSYPDILKESRYCILLPGVREGNPDFMDMLMTGCIPVLTFINRDYVLPFSDLIDWTRLTVTWLSHDLEDVVSALEGYQKKIEIELRMQIFAHYDKYFSSMATITMATLDIVNRRVFPLAKISEPSGLPGLGLDLLTAPKNEGFTAVILTYNRVHSLFEIIRNLGKVRSLTKILVIWNNVDQAPPSVKLWPRVKKPIQIIRSKSNKLSNRFYPYPEITTSAVFSLDDDITMLTTDEIEFAFKAWQEFPNRLVGLPGRVHSELPPDVSTTSRFLKSSSSPSKATGQWKYESSWLNNVSLVLTGAAFYHKYYHFLFTNVMPREIRQWVDKHMNCEDIAMNFLISNHTGLPPLKVTPRKKFKCTSCTSDESLWNDPEHYLERDQCINIFTKFFKGMPLKAVKFRLDPVLFLDSVDDSIKAYPNIGDL